MTDVAALMRNVVAAVAPKPPPPRAEPLTRRERRQIIWRNTAPDAEPYEASLDQAAMSDGGFSIFLASVEALHAAIDGSLVPARLNDAVDGVGRGMIRIPYLAYEPNGDSIVIVQGRHRIAAMRKLGFAFTYVSCHPSVLEPLKARAALPSGWPARLKRNWRVLVLRILAMVPVSKP